METNDNKTFLAEVEEQDVGFESEEKPKVEEHVDHNEAAAHNYETGTDYTDSYEEEDDADKGKAKEKAKGNETEKIVMEKEGDDNDIIITTSLLEKLKASGVLAAAEKKKKKKKGNDYNLVEEDFRTKEKVKESKY